VRRRRPAPPVSFLAVTKPYVFVYQPKTGSSPLLAHLGIHLGWNEGIVYLGPWGDHQRHRQARPNLSSWSTRRLRKIRVLTGSSVSMTSHQVAGAEEGRYLTVMRDPADRFVGDYNAHLEAGEDPPGFFEWYEARRVNQATRYFSGLFGVDSVDAVAERLRDFWFVSTTEHLNQDAPHLLRAMKVPEAWNSGQGREGDLDDVEASDPADTARVEGGAAAHTVITDEIRDRVYEENPRDLRLFKLALKRRASKRSKYGWD